MKFVNYRSDGVEHLGLLTETCDALRRVVSGDDVAEGQKLAALIAEWPSDGAPAIQTTGDPVPLDAVEMLAPIPRPGRNIFCVGKNYQEHVSEFDNSGYDRSRQGNKSEPPAKPIYFTKAWNSVTGPGAPIAAHEHLTKALDYEAELVAIVGRRCQRISPDEAWRYVWGYTLINDVTARDLQRDRQQWFLGKSLDGFCPMGPWAVTADELDPTDLTIECKVNGELRQKANTGSLIFDIPTLVADLSQGITLEPGDLIATGTPSGVGIGFDPPRFLKPGDTVQVSATGLGVLTNVVV